MSLISVKELYGTPWGVVEHRRAEIENGPFGTFDKVYAEELLKKFCTIDMAATMISCSASTARKWLNQLKARYICEGGGNLFVLEDVRMVRDKRKAHYDAIAQQRAEREAAKKEKRRA